MTTSMLKGKTLLVVDDEPDLRGPLVEEFESLGCRVFEAANGTQALEIVRTQKIDAVISDIRMPGGDGVQLLKEIKKLDHAFPVVMLITGFADLSKADAYDLGAEAILAKPFDLDEIDEAVVRILTPLETRWAQPIDLEKIKVSVEREIHSAQLGRGGLFIGEQERAPGVGEMIGLKLKIAESSPSFLSGAGVVRWIRREEENNLPKGYGVEFENLDADSRIAVIQLTDQLKIKSFIPRA